MPARSGHRAVGKAAIGRCRGAFAALGTALCVAVLLGAAQPAVAQTMHTLPLVTPASNTAQRTLVRIVNRSNRSGTVTIHAIDDTGRRRGPARVWIGARQTKHITSQQLESGNGLSGGRGVGDGTGNWRLELETTLDIAPLAYIQGAAGFLTTMHDTVRSEAMRHHVVTFDKAPVSRTQSRAELRVTNPTDDRVSVTITGRDDAGRAGTGRVRFSLAAQASRMLTVDQLEQGHSSFQGRLGTQGRGRWQLWVAANRPIRVMNLMRSPSTGYMTNLSSMKEADVIRGSARGDELWGTSGDDRIEPGDNATSHNLAADPGLDIVHGSRGDDVIVYSDGGEEAFQTLQYSDPDEGDYLSARIVATIDGAANTARINKGSAGTDTIVDVANPLGASGMELVGTRFNDVFNLTLDDGQFLNVEGGAGRDRFNVELIDGGWVRVDYQYSPRGINVDLAARRARNDGHGDVDTFTGDIPRSIGGSEHSDVIRGSERNEWFFGRGGNDDIDARGGWDMLQFGYADRFAAYVDIENLEVDLDAGTATGRLNGRAFSYRIRNFERVLGGSGNDAIRGRIEEVRASTGNDRITYTDGQWTSITYAYLTSGGITATINGPANRATVNKRSAGTDTIVDIDRPLTNEGFGLYGTSSNDVFNITLRDGQWMQVWGGAGNDRINMSFPRGRIDYARGARNGVNIDLDRGRAFNDGFGNVDTIVGSVWEVRGTDHRDVMRGSSNHESFIGRRGDDLIDGRGGFDRVRFDRECCASIAHLNVDLDAGRATGTWNGEAFTYTLRSIEYVRGTNGPDTFAGKARSNEQFQGRGGDDVFIFKGNNGWDRIEDFHDGDVLMLLGLRISKQDVLNNAWAWNEGTGVHIDLRRFGGGRIDLHGFESPQLRRVRLPALSPNRNAPNPLPAPSARRGQGVNPSRIPVRRYRCAARTGL